MVQRLAHIETVASCTAARMEKEEQGRSRVWGSIQAARAVGRGICPWCQGATRVYACQLQQSLFIRYHAPRNSGAWRHPFLRYDIKKLCYEMQPLQIPRQEQRLHLGLYPRLLGHPLSPSAHWRATDYMPAKAARSASSKSSLALSIVPQGQRWLGLRLCLGV